MGSACCRDDYRTRRVESGGVNAQLACTTRDENRRSRGTQAAALCRGSASDRRPVRANRACGTRNGSIPADLEAAPSELRQAARQSRRNRERAVSPSPRLPLRVGLEMPFKLSQGIANDRVARIDGMLCKGKARAEGAFDLRIGPSGDVVRKPV